MNRSTYDVIFWIFLIAATGIFSLSSFNMVFAAAGGGGSRCGEAGSLDPYREPMQEKYNQSKTYLGVKTSEVVISSDGIGVFQDFEHGSIYWSAKTCKAQEIHGPIWRKWTELDRTTFGYPLTDVVPTPDGAAYSEFDGGKAIYWSSSSGTHAIWGEIFHRWNEMTDQDIFIGYPISDQQSRDSRGAFAHFQNGSIFWSPETGSHVLTGHIYNQYRILDWEKSDLGYPVTDSSIRYIPSTTVPDIEFSKFERGYIYWMPDHHQVNDKYTGIHTTTGPFRLLNVCVESFEIKRSHDIRENGDWDLVVFINDNRINIVKSPFYSAVQDVPLPSNQFADRWVPNPDQKGRPGCVNAIPVLESGELRISTLGVEYDTAHINIPTIPDLSELPKLAFTKYIDYLVGLGTFLTSTFEALNVNDEVGHIRKSFSSSDDFGNGFHSDLSIKEVNGNADTQNDFLLNYRINVYTAFD